LEEEQGIPGAFSNSHRTPSVSQALPGALGSPRAAPKPRSGRGYRADISDCGSSESSQTSPNQHHTRPNSHLSPVVTAYGSMSGVREQVAVFFQLGGIVQLEGGENLFGLDGFQKNSLLCGSLHSRTEAAGYFRKVINTECV